MSEITRDQVERVFRTFEAKDLGGMMACFAKDALLFDPHYPVKEMRGETAIRQGLTWGIGSMEQPGFTLRHLWIDGETAVAELDTHHVLKGGMKLNFPQIFVIESRDGLITRLQSYVPYSPPGIGGLLTKITRMLWKVQGKLK